ncbi:hypothetical protein WICMUC_003177 [Wickerhamomyces mucosus]|uniref:AB hydrolase-1 domain-containing protein n=1 Tax=Wickerhamomyces mucosus TaxID=1378264 RepID=A0A9P8TDS9_9ASCO|nr:hypothetical protein WICMUC_003177 [Wickerhamomyces mucosus]
MSNIFEVKEPSKFAKKTTLIGGIPVHAYYNSALANPFDESTFAEAESLKVLFLLHGLSRSSDTQEEIGKTILHHYYPLVAEVSSDNIEPLIIFSFDHRNHGARLQDSSRNLNYKGGNDYHSADMLSYIDAATHDLKNIIDFLPGYIPLLSNFKLTKILGGVSLGGHSVIRFVTAYPGVFDGAIPIVGSFDLTSLYINRLQPLGETQIYNSSYKDIKDKLLDIKYYPEALFLKSAKDDSFVYHNYDINKLKTLALFGKTDKVVTLDHSIPFLDKINQLPKDRSLLDVNEKFQAIHYPAGHVVNEEMIDDITKWLVYF